MKIFLAASVASLAMFAGVASPASSAICYKWQVFVENQYGKVIQVKVAQSQAQLQSFLAHLQVEYPFAQLVVQQRFC